MMFCLQGLGVLSIAVYETVAQGRGDTYGVRSIYSPRCMYTQTRYKTCSVGPSSLSILELAQPLSRQHCAYANTRFFTPAR